MNLEDLFKKGWLLLKENQIENAKFDTKILLGNVLEIETNRLFLSDNIEVSLEKEKQFLDFISRRCKHEPVSKIIGKRGFWKDEFFISKETLDPRPDTETLIEAVLSEFEDKNARFNILDLGTGSGCIALSLAGEFPNSKVTGIDISRDAVKIAEKNASALGLSDNCTFLNLGWSDFALENNKKFDIIVSNPPYIKEDDIKSLDPEVAVYDPILALSGGKTGLEAYYEISSFAHKLLQIKGKMFLEIGQGQEQDVKKIFNKKEVVFKKEYLDLSKTVRCLGFCKE